MTFKPHVHATSTLPAPTSSNEFIMDTGSVFDLKMKTPKVLDENELYDWYIVEFTKPIFFA